MDRQELCADDTATQTTISEEIRDGLSPWLDWLARALTYDDRRGDAERYRAMTITMRWAGALDLWRVQTIATDPFGYSAVPLFVFAALIGMVPRFERVATLVFAYGYWHAVVGYFPFTWNHTWLGAYMFTWLALVGPRQVDGRKLAIAGVRAVVLYSLIGAGIQKILHASYFRGEFMASRGYQFVHGPLGDFLFSASDQQRFATIDQIVNGQRVVPEALMVKIASNVVWIGEIVAGVLLLIPKTLLWGIAAVLLLMAPIQLGTLEFGFLGLLLAAMLSYVPSRWLRGSVLFMGCYVIAVAIFWSWQLYGGGG